MSSEEALMYHTSEGFWPPYCPNTGCIQARHPRGDGFLRHGYYSTRLRGDRIPRFLCKSCRRTMSSQTFDETYRLRMPELEDAIRKEVDRGISMRRVAEVLGINRKTVSRRLRRAERLRAGGTTLGRAS
jgi:transposase-like protein